MHAQAQHHRQMHQGIPVPAGLSLYPAPSFATTPMERARHLPSGVHTPGAVPVFGGDDIPRNVMQCPSMDGTASRVVKQPYVVRSRGTPQRLDALGMSMGATQGYGPMSLPADINDLYNTSSMRQLLPPGSAYMPPPPVPMFEVTKPAMLVPEGLAGIVHGPFKTTTMSGVWRQGVYVSGARIDGVAVSPLEVAAGLPSVMRLQAPSVIARSTSMQTSPHQQGLAVMHRLAATDVWRPTAPPHNGGCA